MLRLLTLTFSLAFFAFASFCPIAQATNYPTKTVQVVVPWPPGGADISARIIGEKMREITGQSFYVSNISGAAGMTGATQVQNARPDGYTILWEHAGNLTISPLLSQAPFTWRDFELVCAVGYSDIALIVRGNSHWNTAMDLIEEIRANPGKIRWAMAINVVSHITYLDIATAAGGLNVMPIPTPGDRPRIVSVLGNHSDVATVQLPAADAYVRSGDIKILGMVTQERSRFAPEIPTLREQGIDAGNVYLYTVFVPKGTPQDVIQRLAAAYKEAVESPEIQEAFAAQHLVARFKDSAEATAFWAREAELNERLARTNNLLR